MQTNGNHIRRLFYRSALFAGLIFAGILAAFMLMMWHIGIDGEGTFKSPEIGEASIKALRISIIGFCIASSIGSICVVKIIESYFSKSGGPPKS